MSVRTEQARRHRAAKNREYVRAHNAATQAWLAAMKLALGCQRCGSRPSESAELHFHHSDASTKSFALAKAGGRSRERIEAEVAKCEVLCAACHIDTHR